MNILIVGGTFDNDGGKPSSLVGKIAAAISEEDTGNVIIENGGYYDELEKLLDSAKDHDVVFWWPNVPNDLPKIRDVKAVAPHVMLVSSKRNDNGKYKFGELVGRALTVKANLCFEFSRTEKGIFSMRVFDPLGSSWYEGEDVDAAVKAALGRLRFLIGITRNTTTQSDTPKELVMAWYFDRFKQDMQSVPVDVVIPDEEKFVSLVKEYAEIFQSLMPGAQTTRFLGNASMHPPVPPQVGRCGKGMPSFKKNGYVFVSQRNVDKQFLSLDNFVPAYLEDGKVFYCGDRKPSVDTPIQLRLYEKLENIHYMIHSHCYIKGAPFTGTSVPCGAVEEVDEILSAIEVNYDGFDLNRYVVNLIGHGSIVMGSSLEDMDKVEYYGRPMPEKMF